jgi:hypothetical protein
MKVFECFLEKMECMCVLELNGDETGLKSYNGHNAMFLIDTPNRQED